MQGKWRRFEETTGGIFGRCIEYVQVKTFEENIHQLVFKECFRCVERVWINV